MLRNNYQLVLTSFKFLFKLLKISLCLLQIFIQIVLHYLKNMCFVPKNVQTAFLVTQLFCLTIYCRRGRPAMRRQMSLTVMLKKNVNMRNAALALYQTPFIIHQSLTPLGFVAVFVVLRRYWNLSSDFVGKWLYFVLVNNA